MTATVSKAARYPKGASGKNKRERIARKPFLQHHRFLRHMHIFAYSGGDLVGSHRQRKTALRSADGRRVHRIA
jgi:hypothetical protein